MNLTFGAYHVTKSYQGNPVLKDCSYSFERGGVYALMGPNGSGKSTFLRLCALLEDPDHGKITYFDGGRVLKKDIELRRMITLVLPKVGVFNTTAFKNVSYGLRLRGMKRGETEEKVEKALDFVALLDKGDQNALTLSSGETQRLGIARAIVIEPAVLFLDEPTASVDRKNTEIIEEIILKMKKEGGSAVVITTHDGEQAERLADYMLIMRDGEISAG
ncbi:MAG TPA: phosphate ABC transporter ATP-binding protein [Thermodesulfovibrionales bacterium]|nr:phosphate ABC transporter ATP-binding protein [Thermodesulfovibrionales bacterium]